MCCQLLVNRWVVGSFGRGGRQGHNRALTCMVIILAAMLVMMELLVYGMATMGILENARAALVAKGINPDTDDGVVNPNIVDEMLGEMIEAVVPDKSVEHRARESELARERYRRNKFKRKPLLSERYFTRKGNELCEVSKKEFFSRNRYGCVFRDWGEPKR